MTIQIVTVPKLVDLKTGFTLKITWGIKTKKLYMQELYPKTIKSRLLEVRQGYWKFCCASREILSFSQGEIHHITENLAKTLMELN